MKSRDFRAVLRARPFCPFSFTTVNSETYAVDDPDDAWLAPDGDVVVGFLVRLAAGFPTRPASSPPQHRGPLRRRFSFRYRVATG